MSEMENIKEELLKIVELTTLEEISQISASWLRTFGQNEIPALIMQFRSHYKSFISQMAVEIIEKEAKMKARVENLLNERKKLEQKLELTIVVHPGDDLPLFPFMKELDENVSFYREMLDRRLEEIASLRAKEKVLCVELGTEVRPPANPSKSLMSTDEIRQFEDHVKALQRLKLSRLDDIVKHQRLGKILLEKLGEGFESFPLTTKENYLEPTIKNVKKLQDEVYELELLHAERIIMLNDMNAKLNALYDEMKVAKDQRIDMTSSRPSKDNIDQVADELRRLKQLKLSKLPESIEDLRSRIIDMSEKCCKSEMFKHYSAAFHCPIYNENHQKRLQFALKDLESFYELNKDIFKLIAEREEIKSKYAEHSRKLMETKDRLKNRGGQLLKDEKERKLLEKNLQRIEAALAKATEVYEAKNKSPFLLFDEPVKVNVTPSPSHLSKGLKKQHSITELRLKKPFSDRSNVQ